MPFQLITYSSESFDIHHCGEFKSAFELASDAKINWINMDIRNQPELEIIVKDLQLHRLLVEDIYAKHELPKFELFDDVAYLGLHMLHQNKLTLEFDSEHVSFLLKNNLIITIQDNTKGDVFRPDLLNKLQLNFKRYFQYGVDFLFLILVDSIVNGYSEAMENLRTQLEDLEELMVKKPAINLMRKIMEYKHEINILRKFIIPLKDELQRIKTDAPILISKHNFSYHRDILDHLNTLNMSFENIREILRDLSDLHQSNQNLQLNNIMKTLTVISAIFIPLTFIVGLYGMNFEFPEKNWNFGYLYVWILILVVALGMIFYMRKRRWF